MQMKSVVVDKIGSIAQACGLGHELRVATTDIPCEEGVVLVVEVLTNKSTYNQLELTSGRMAKVSKGDVIVGALGHRQALFGYSGHIPEKVAVGDVIQVLNIGGVLGICDSVESRQGPAVRRARARLRAAVSVPRRAHRRAGPRRLSPARPGRDARHARRAGRGARRHLHGGRQDGGCLRDREPHAASRPRRARVQGDGRLAAP